MARINNLTNFLNDVSSAIKQKTGDSTPIPAADFDTEILSIETPGVYQEKSIEITQNGNYNLLPDTGYDALSNARISVTVSGGDTSDATAQADDLIYPKTAYARGSKITGSIIPTYEQQSVSLNTNTLTVSNKITITTRDGKGLLIWENDYFYTYLYNENNHQYEYKQQFYERDIGIDASGGQEYTRQMDCSCYTNNEDNVVYVVAHRWKNNICCFCWHVTDGTLDYQDDGYFGHFAWRDNYVEPCDVITFSSLRADIFYYNACNGYYRYYSHLSKINVEGTKTDLQTWSQTSGFMQWTADDKYLLINGILYKNNNYTNVTEINTSFGQGTINSSSTKAILDGYLWEIQDSNDTLTKIRQISQSAICDVGDYKNFWLGEHILGCNSSNVWNIYNTYSSVELLNSYNNINRLSPIHANYNCMSCDNYTSCLILNYLVGAQSLIALRKNNKDFLSLEKANASNSDILFGKKAYIQSGLTTGTYVPLDTSDATATAEDIAYGKTAYAKGQKVTGTHEEPTLTKYEYLNNYAYTGTFDTGVKGGDDTEVIIKFKGLSNLWTSTSVALFGVRTKNDDTGTNENAFSLTTWSNGNFNFYDSDNRSSSSLINSSSPIQLKCNSTGLYKYNESTEQYDILATISNPHTFTTDGNIYLCGRNIPHKSGGEVIISNEPHDFPIVTIYFMKIYKSGVLVKDLVPAKYGDDVGFYDEVEQKFIKSDNLITTGPEITE